MEGLRPGYDEERDLRRAGWPQRAWSAHLLPQTGHDLGMKSCMIGMHGLHSLFNNIR